MATLCNSGIGGPLWRAQALIQASIQAWAFHRLVRVDYAFGDLPSTIIALLAASLAAAGNALAKNILRRAGQGALFAQGLTAADTMVAAGGR
jgi:hypothetical protein